MAAAGGRRSQRAAVAIYADRRMLAILAMGFASGLPLPLTFATLGYWLKKVGVDLTTIGLFSLVGLPYALKILWAPAVDRMPIPWLTAAFGRRRSWTLCAQAGLAAAIASLGATDPAQRPLATAACAFAIALFSATQDVAIDAWRIEMLAPDEQGPGASATQLGYRLGLLASGAGAVALSDFAVWSTVFLAMAALLGVGVAAALLAPEPPPPPREPPRPGTSRWRSALRAAVVAPLADFAQRRGWLAILLLAALYKFGDAVGGVMATPFYVDLGFSGIEIASATNVWGIVATMAGIAAGGALVVRLGIFGALLVGGVLQAATNLLYTVLALAGRDLAVLTVAVGADSFSGGLGSAAIVAYLSGLCRARFTATQFALLTSFSAIGRTGLAASSGWLAERTGWPLFFASTALLALPGLALVLRLRRIDARDR